MATTPSSQTHTAQTTIDLHRGLPEGLEMFDVIEDPRTGNATRHPFGSILFIALCALLCGMNTCEDFARFAKAREDWLKKWISLPNGIPCPNTFLRVFAAINPVSFSACLVEFVTHISLDLKGKLVAIDGKTIRGSRNADESTVQILSAWACHNDITLSQLAVDQKSNEITAVPKLLRQLNLKGAIVSPRIKKEFDDEKGRFNTASLSIKSVGRSQIVVR
ncbi:MAG: ISAs1 family transposase [Akkermansiaceae bacterium]|nr:ISAs1 family transposase [Akkermansiaceae bacterium]